MRDKKIETTIIASAMTLPYIAHIAQVTQCFYFSRVWLRLCGLGAGFCMVQNVRLSSLAEFVAMQYQSQLPGQCK